MSLQNKLFKKSMVLDIGSNRKCFVAKVVYRFYRTSGFIQTPINWLFWFYQQILRKPSNKTFFYYFLQILSITRKQRCECPIMAVWFVEKGLLTASSKKKNKQRKLVFVNKKKSRNAWANITVSRKKIFIEHRIKFWIKKKTVI